MGSPNMPPNIVPTAAKPLLAKMGAWPIYRITAAILVLAIPILTYVLKAPSLALLLAPIFLGSLLMGISADRLTDAVDHWETIFESRGERAAAKDGKFARYFSRPLWAGSKAMWRKTENVASRHFRAGLRLAAVTYYFGLMISALVMVAYVSVAVVIVVAFIWLALWLLGKYLGGEDDDHGSYEPSSHVATRPVGATSRKVQGVFGERVDHYNERGQKVAESHQHQGVFGNYVETVDKNGNKVGESRECDGVFGKYIEHTDEHLEKIGETRQREGVFGPYAEHTDKHGQKTGESREQEGVFGEYTQHEHQNNKNNK